jgi:hypothetical protein
MKMTRGLLAVIFLVGLFYKSFRVSCRRNALCSILACLCGVKYVFATLLPGSNISGRV